MKSVGEMLQGSEGVVCLGPYLAPAALCVCVSWICYTRGVASCFLKILTVTLHSFSNYRAISPADFLSEVLTLLSACELLLLMLHFLWLCISTGKCSKEYGVLDVRVGLSIFNAAIWKYREIAAERGIQSIAGYNDAGFVSITHRFAWGPLVLSERVDCFVMFDHLFTLLCSPPAGVSSCGPD